MLFNSVEFAIFLPIVFIVYWILSKNVKIQNIFLLVASYFFYGWWDWRFLMLILFSTCTDYLVGFFLSKQVNNHKRKVLLWISVFVNISFLGFFKYFNFFIDNFIAGFSFLGVQFSPYHLNIILPVGISFYTFQTMSYTIDVYKRKLEATKNFVTFATFVSFFPQLVAGPIERATNLLPQIARHRTFDYVLAVEGMRQILWGLFKKMVIADNCATIANRLFEDYQTHSGSTLLLGAVFFTFQIYGDFSGYSDVAIGSGKLLGFRLMRNFSFPYFSRDIAEFWRRWHISLSTWFRDYVYIPLGGSKGTKGQVIRNTFVIFLVSGFWHGANWTFILWGAYHALLFLPLTLLGKNRKYTGIVAEDSILPNVKELFQMGFTFLLVVFGWILFRAENTGHAIHYISEICSSTLFTMPDFTGGKRKMLFFIGIFVLIEWIFRRKDFCFQTLPANNVLRWIIYIILIFAIIILRGNQAEFIYFQF